MKVAIVYHFIPHYRKGVILKLVDSDVNEYYFFGQSGDYEGIRHLELDGKWNYSSARFKSMWGMTWQSASVWVACSRKFDAIVYLGNPNFISAWVGAALARLLGKKVLFWTHGWLLKEKWFKARLRNLFLSLAHKVLVYNERARHLGIASGFPAERIVVIYNSLDYDTATQVYEAIERGEASVNPRNFFSEPSWPLLICTARLTRLCRFDLLIEAAHQLTRRGLSVNILLIGDGPERAALECFARDKGLPVHFFGACYSEAILGSLIHGADLTVSPGKVGLTAMHSLMYGTPVVTHSQMDDQMPEVEAIVDGLTGTFFRRGDVEDLARVIDGWLTAAPNRAEIRAACRRTITEKWNPANQVRLIEDAIKEIGR